MKIEALAELPAIHNPEAERDVISAMLASNECIDLANEGLQASDFFSLECRNAFAAICILRQESQAVDPFAVSEYLKRHEIEGADRLLPFLAELTARTVPTLTIQSRIDSILRDASARAIQQTALETVIDLQGNKHDPTEVLRRARKAFENVREPVCISRELLASRLFSIDNPPLPDRSVYSLSGITIATPGNLISVQSKPKAGKSSFVGAGLVAPAALPGDTLCLASSNPEGRAVIHFDTEQSAQDHHSLVATALRRVGLIQPPEWLYSYRIKDVPSKERMALLEYTLAECNRKHGGIHSAWLDGGVDFLPSCDPNNTEESFHVIDHTALLAVKYDCPVFCVVHYNPGGEFNKTRGHYGSQLERKAATSLSLEKTDGVTCVFTPETGARKEPISKDRGPRFAWDAESGMHVSCETAGAARNDARLFTLQAVRDQIFTDHNALKYSELRTQVERVKGCKDKTAEKAIRDMVELGLIKKDMLNQYIKGDA